MQKIELNAYCEIIEIEDLVEMNYVKKLSPHILKLGITIESNEQNNMLLCLMQKFMHLLNLSIGIMKELSMCMQ